MFSQFKNNKPKNYIVRIRPRNALIVKSKNPARFLFT